MTDLTPEQSAILAVFDRIESTNKRLDAAIERADAALKRVNAAIERLNAMERRSQIPLWTRRWYK